MTCLDKWMIGACVVTLSGVAFADGVNSISSEQMILANIGPAPLPVNAPPPAPPVSIAAVPAVPVTLYPFGREGAGTPPRPDDNALLYTHIEAINDAAPITDGRHMGWVDTSTEKPAVKAARSYLSIGPSVAPRLSLVQWDNADDKLGSDPKRGLALKTQDWTVSASARVPLLGQHDIGATVYVKRRF
ncbi:hypothetical protein [Pandoraea apista]|uniref:Uncharacterized protein n=1 Tax=Pandoraea apista TaxID=93218 RepID=A0ABX9ZMN5_9BURK|nr:hypothetical protein [Pandoraea apista]RRJ30162.1 hypothetical protein EIB05_14865 [Pandoraea apista]RRJ74376.1 hypothetical protein EIL82_15990 [Pandoraea apista]RSD08956.1 hypothetical protein EJB12_15725 [Pandoraea apista]RSK79019.1 hypothetical protein EJE83_15690 [Pandoraea apista]RSK82320.1 hypothetical protein EJE96_12910 [Pandoraea apista]